MSTEVILTLVTVFVAVALLTGAGTALLVSRSTSAGRRRLKEIVDPGTTFLITPQEAKLAAEMRSGWDSITDVLPTSRGTVKRLKREMTLAGFQSPAAPALLSIAEMTLPLVIGAIPLFLFDGFNRWMWAIGGAGVGYMAPGLFLGQRISARKREIQNGLADALDLLVLCLEAGTSLDQALVKAGEELRVAYPALGDQFQIVISEMRAGKARLDAFRGLADRTQVEDVRALVTMLVQTDRFGTSISQALRTHANVCRTKRRQRAEERAQKVGVKLVFPLVFCLFPALFVVLLGPAFIEFARVFGNMGN